MFIRPQMGDVPGGRRRRAGDAARAAARAARERARPALDRQEAVRGDIILFPIRI